MSGKGCEKNTMETNAPRKKFKKKQSRQERGGKNQKNSQKLRKKKKRQGDRLLGHLCSGRFFLGVKGKLAMQGLPAQTCKGSRKKEGGNPLESQPQYAVINSGVKRRKIPSKHPW